MTIVIRTASTFTLTAAALVLTSCGDGGKPAAGGDAGVSGGGGTPSQNLIAEAKSDAPVTSTDFIIRAERASTKAESVDLYNKAILGRDERRQYRPGADLYQATGGCGEEKINPTTSRLFNISP